MGDDTRDDVQRAFNSPPEKDPVRILVATDAAREGVNLQAHCTDLFHIDIPWNPARLEQRNGRIDRTLQPAEEVHCHYFLYPERVEDPVLAAVVRKVDIVQRELGSLGAVLLGQLENVLENGISGKTQSAVDKIGTDPKSSTVNEELEGSNRDFELLRKEIEVAGDRLEASKRALQVDPEALQGVVDIGMRLAGAQPLLAAGKTSNGRPTFTLPTLDRSWEQTLDTLRPPRRRDEAFWEWRQKPPKSVTFHPLKLLSEDAEQLHLAHPFVKRVLDRFLAQGFGAHDLSRCTAVVAPNESVIRVVAYARLTLFGSGAARLHDQVVAIAAAWSSDARPVEPYKDRATFARTIVMVEKLLATGAVVPNATISARIQKHTTRLFQDLWPHLKAEADALEVEARLGLGQRARRESEAMRKLIQTQREAIEESNVRLRKLSLFDVHDKEKKRQIDLDLKHLERRRELNHSELDTEPVAIEALYEVRMSRLTPLGLVVAWPEAMT